MRNVHVWKTTTPDGEKREVRATKFSKEWKFQSKLKGDEDWTYHKVPLLQDLEELHDILFRKYQRKRLSYDDVASVEQLLREQRAANPALSESSAESVADEDSFSDLDSD